MRRKTEPFRVLYFDCESRPLGWIGSDYVHQEVTVIAWCWQNSTPQVRALSKDDRSRGRMLSQFRSQFDLSGMVVGHYIRGFDLPLVNAMLAEVGQKPLGAKLTHDTKIDLVKLHGVSKSQKNLADMFGLEDEKLDMTVPDWRHANRLTSDGVAKAVDRAVLDVVQNMALHAELRRRSLLGPPKVWQP